MFKRMVLAARLDVDFYEKVEADASYLKESFLVVLLVAALGNLGMVIAYDGPMGDGFLTRIITLVFGMLSDIFLWVAWAGITLFIGTTVTKGPQTQSNMGEMLRTLGYAQGPKLLIFLVIIPEIGTLDIGSMIAATGWVWSLVAGVVAVRQALDFSTTRALITTAIGWFMVGTLWIILRFI